MRRWAVVFTFFIGFFVVESIVNAEGNQLIIINKAINQLAFYENGELVRSFKVGTGRQQSFTPEGMFQIVNKIKNRPYYTDNIPGGDPRNPLGDRWLGLNARGTYGTTYAIHGNSNPNSIGGYVSAGCVRMYNDEVRWLFDRVDLFTTVIITNSSKSFETIAQTNGYSSFSKIKSVSVDKISPQPENSTIAITTSTLNSIPTLYKYSIYDGEAWVTIQDFSAAKTINWKPTKAGDYQVKVQTKSTSSDKAYDDEKVISYDIFTPGLIDSVKLSTQSPLPVNTQVTLSTKTNNDQANTIEYSVFNGLSWSPLSSNVWKPTKSGEYQVRTRVKNKQSQNEFDDEKLIDFTVYEPAAITSLIPNKKDPQPTHTSTSFMAESNSNSENLFQFFVHDEEKWKIIQDYSPNDSVSWTPIDTGEYTIMVHAKHKLSQKEYDTQFSISYTVFEPAAIEAVTTDIGAYVGLKNFKAKATRKKKNEYRFSYYDGEKWRVFQAYSINNEADWTPSKPGIYKIRVEARHILSGNEFDDSKEYLLIVYEPSPYIAFLPVNETIAGGSEVTIKVSAKGKKLSYQFQLIVGSEVFLLKDFSRASRYAWTTPLEPGEYQIRVIVREHESRQEYVAEQTYYVV